MNISSTALFFFGGGVQVGQDAFKGVLEHHHLSRTHRIRTVLGQF